MTLHSLLNKKIVAGLLLCSTLAAPNIIFDIPARAAQPGNSGFKIVDDASAKAVIVTANEPSDVVRYASIELQWHIEQATGVKLPIITEDSAASALQSHRIYIGKSAFTDNAGLLSDKLPKHYYQIKQTNKDIYLVGNDADEKNPNPLKMGDSGAGAGTRFGRIPVDPTLSMGSLFAVYEWLENQLNVKWIWPDETGTIIPKTKIVFSGASQEKQGGPSLLYAQPRINTWEGMDLTRKEKYIFDTNVWLRRQRFSRSANFSYGHGYTKYWERFHRTNPEFFAMRHDGKREPFNPKRPNLVQLCVSEPKLHQQIIADWLEQRAKDPSRPWINGKENDKTAMDPACQCPECLAWDAKDGVLSEENPWLSGREIARQEGTPQISLSDRYAKFWLALQKEGRKHDPDATVIGYAYADYSEPPLETKLNKNIIVGIVPAKNYPYSEKEAQEFKRIWDGWAATGASLYLRPNNFLTGYNMPYVYAKQFGHDYKHAAQNGLVATDYDSLIGMWGVQGINLYMAGRLNAHPELTVQEVLQEYYAAFGSASKPIEKYFDYWEEVTLKADTEFRLNAQGGWSPLSRAGDQIYTPETFVRGRELLEEARSSAGDDREVLARIAFLNLWLEHARLTMEVLSSFNKYRMQPQSEKLKSNFEVAKINLDNYRAQHADKIVNVGFLNYLESWRRWKPPVK